MAYLHHKHLRLLIFPSAQRTVIRTAGAGVGLREGDGDGGVGGGGLLLIAERLHLGFSVQGAGLSSLREPRCRFLPGLSFVCRKQPSFFTSASVGMDLDRYR